MLSIVIPTHNYNCYYLVDDLHKQAITLNVPFEILVADDASTLEETKMNNRQINSLSNCHFIELQENLGRARIRNFLAETAQYKYLLLMDCDAGVVNDEYLKNYWDIRDKAEVIIGGILNPPTLPSPKVSLRYYYEESAATTRTLEQRNSTPYSQFTPFNFFIHRDTFLSIQFDDSFTKYGHEDTVFGMQLEKEQISILHINNPLYHLGLEENSIYLKKVNTSIETLISQKEKLESHSQLYAYYIKLKKAGMIPLILFTYYIFKKGIIRNLHGKHPNMKIFAFYKLGYLCDIIKQEKNKTS